MYQSDMEGKKEKSDLTPGTSEHEAMDPEKMKSSGTRVLPARRVSSGANPRRLSNPRTPPPNDCMFRRNQTCCFALVLTVGFGLGLMTAYVIQLSRYDSALENERKSLENRLNQVLDGVEHREQALQGSGKRSPNTTRLAEIKLLKANGSGDSVVRRRGTEHVAARVTANGGGDSVARLLEQQVRVLCWVMTYPANHEKKAQHVKATWGKRCNKLLFMSSESDDKLGTIKLNVTEGRDHLWAKTKAAFKYVHTHHRNDADWFMKADDDTYVIVENLRYMLSEHDTNEAQFFGCRFRIQSEVNYTSGGAGYVLSKAALDKFVTEGLTNSSNCRPDDGGYEDLEMGVCLSKVGVKFGDSRDRYGRSRFFPFDPATHIAPGGSPDQPVDPTWWFLSYSYYSVAEGVACCSDYAVSFHYVQPRNMYVMDYLVYYLRPYGVVEGSLRYAREAGGRKCRRWDGGEVGAGVTFHLGDNAKGFPGDV